MRKIKTIRIMQILLFLALLALGMYMSSCSKQEFIKVTYRVSHRGPSELAYLIGNAEAEVIKKGEWDTTQVIALNKEYSPELRLRIQYYNKLGDTAYIKAYIIVNDEIKDSLNRVLDYCRYINLLLFYEHK